MLKGGGGLKYFNKIADLCYSVHCKFHMDLPGIKPRPLW